MTIFMILWIGIHWSSGDNGWFSVKWFSSKFSSLVSKSHSGHFRNRDDNEWWWILIREFRALFILNYFPQSSEGTFRRITIMELFHMTFQCLVRTKHFSTFRTITMDFTYMFWIPFFDCKGFATWCTLD